MTPIFIFNSTKQSMTWTKYDIEISTMYLVDHPTENVTVDSLIADFTALEDSIDDVCDRFQDRLKHSKNETNEKLQTQTSEPTTIHVPNDETGEETPIVDAHEQTPAVAVGSFASSQPISHMSRPKRDSRFFKTVFNNKWCTGEYQNGQLHGIYRKKCRIILHYNKITK